MEEALPKGGEGASATAAASASTATAVVTKGVLPVGARVLHNDGRLGVVRQMSDSGKTRWVAYDGDDDDADAVKVWSKVASLTRSFSPLLATRSVAKDEATEPSQPIVFLSRRMSAKFDAEKPSLTRPFRLTKCADAEALWLRRALESQGVTVLPREKQGAGQDWMEHIFDAVDRCHLFIVFGTDSYGEKTSSEYSTHVEFKLACKEQKPIAHIKMTSGDKSGIIEKFTRHRLELMNLIYETWEWSKIPKSMPDTIIPWLVRQLSPDGVPGAPVPTASSGASSTEEPRTEEASGYTNAALVGYTTPTKTRRYDSPAKNVFYRQRNDPPSTAKKRMVRGYIKKRFNRELSLEEAEMVFDMVAKYDDDDDLWIVDRNDPRLKDALAILDADAAIKIDGDGDAETKDNSATPILLERPANPPPKLFDDAPREGLCSQLRGCVVS